MSSKGTQLLAVVVAIFVGFVLAYGAHKLATQSSSTANNPPPLGLNSPSPSAAPSVAPSTAPSVAPPAPTPSAAPSPVAPPSPLGPAAYPPELQAGSSYPIAAGDNALFALASDSIDGGSGACAGINESTQSFPSGYEGSYYVAVKFGDGTVIYAGYLRYGSTPRQDFAEVQRGGKTFPANGPAGSATTPGSHTFCVTHTASGWVETDNGGAIPCPGCPAEPATSLSGATVLFESSAQWFTGSHTGFSLTIPGFHDLSVGGTAPRQLRGTVQHVPV